MVRRRREKDDVRAGVVAPSAAGITGRLRAGHSGLDSDAVACRVVSQLVINQNCPEFTCFPLGDPLADFDDLTSRLVSRTALVQR